MKMTGLIILAASLCSMSNAVEINWASGSDGNWGTEANWSPAQVPTAADDVTVGFNNAVTVESGTIATANSITMDTSTLAGKLDVESGAGLNVIGDYVQNKGILSLRLDDGASRTIGGNMTLNMAGRILLWQKGISDYGLSIGGDLKALGNNSRITFNLNGSEEYGAISVGGVTSLAEGKVDLDLDTNNTSNVTNDVLVLIRNSSTNAVVGGFRNAPFGSTTYTLNGTEYTLYQWDYDDDGNINDIALVAPSAITVETNTWIAVGDGDWNVAENWDLGRVPVATDAAVLTNDVMVTVSDDQSAASFDMNAGTLRVDLGDLLGISENLVVDGGMVETRAGSSRLVVNGNFYGNAGLIRTIQGGVERVLIGGDMTASSNFRFDFNMNNTEQSIGWITVDGALTLDNPDLTLRNFVHNDQETILLVRNSSTNDVTGWFASGVPSIYDLGGEDAYLLTLWDYDNDGYSNDVVLTTLAEIRGYDVWANDWGVDIGSNTNDYDGDGLDNLGEYGLGGDPTNSLDKGYVPSFFLSGEDMVYVHAQRTNDASLIYYLETCDNLVFGSWTNAGYSVTGTNEISTFGFVTNLIPASDPNTFVRLMIEEN